MYLRNHIQPTPQSAPLPGQASNNAGGFSWTLDDRARLRRFLVLGTEGGTYYASERKLTLENVGVLDRILDASEYAALQAVADIEYVSMAGIAPKNDPALFALAYLAKKGKPATRAAAFEVLPNVARTGAHLLHFVDFVDKLGGWGRGTRRAVGRWFTTLGVDKLAYQLVKYQSRDGWRMRDVLRLAHPRPTSPIQDQVMRWAVGKEPEGMLPEVLEGYRRIQTANTAREAADIIRKSNLPREAVPTQWLTERPVWEALLEGGGTTMVTRNLGNLTRLGVLGDQAALDRVLHLLGEESVRRSLIHPIQVLAALKTYAQGHGERGTNVWTPVQKVVDALDAAFYSSFHNVQPAGKRTYLALDISGSMFSNQIAGIPGLDAATASAAMAMVTMAAEPHCDVFGFTTKYEPLALSPRRRLDDNLEVMRKASHRMGGTDCAKPMLHAAETSSQVDTFQVYTDSETWAGRVHPSVALDDYRRRFNQRAKLIVVGMTATQFTIARPDDPGSLDVVGFDASAPALMADFARS